MRRTYTSHGMTQTRLYHIWDNMRGRTTRPRNSNYKNYGGRGVVLCEEWKTFVPFAEWALANGYQDSLLLDRVDNDGPYSPENCQWTTWHEQARNKRNNVWIDYKGERVCQIDLARRLGVSDSCVRNWLRAGKLQRWNHEVEHHAN